MKNIISDIFFEFEKIALTKGNSINKSENCAKTSLEINKIYNKVKEFEFISKQTCNPDNNI